MDNIELITRMALDFRDKRDWKQFHSLKNLGISLAIESAELLELLQWKTDSEIDSLIMDDEFKEQLGFECADILIYLLLISEKAGVDIAAVAKKKIDLNQNRYPVEKAKGNAKKHTEL